MRGKEEMLNKIGAGHRMVEPDDPQAGPEPNTMWALKDVSFTVNKGEIVGIIGKNGAGKSTLLKLLTRITEPTSGEAIMRGRVASLLEVGTGFHGELTGRENIYLNGAILGMKKKEIDEKFDEIVEFSGVEKFIDTPVKRYSSGMYVRLAFAVAAHLEPEILLVDEVLAVGDAEFQKKCLGKMKDIAAGGRTVLFVSHNMAAIENLCTRTIVLKDGHLLKDDLTKESIAAYMAQGINLQGQNLLDFSNRKGSGEIRIINISLRDGNDRLITLSQSGGTLKIVLKFMKLCSDFNRRIYVSISCNTMMGVPVFLQHNRMAGVNFDNLPKRGEFICEIDTFNLTPSTYILSATIIEGTDYVDIIPDALQLTVESGNYLGGGEVPPPSFGPCLMKAKWSIVSDNIKEDKICR
ncbi:ABC transporter ATP-binding protein [Candidatus Atribacteria bacterium HGW-Atribacteria-1]|nr:MAG: ABC transporter ATP-binding protein [Candidatus Atribacteria bacterium HGW-Atribacteria-1]